MAYSTVQVTVDGSLCRIRLDRPDHGNTITERMVDEIHHALDTCQDECGVVLLEGTPEVFCHGADLATYRTDDPQGAADEYDPSPLFELWLRLASGPFVTVTHARGTTKAGGVGFVAASDIVIAEEKATFSLTELLFGLYPAMVLPFLRRRIGDQRAHYMTLMTKPVSATQASDWGLVDVCAQRSDAAVALHLGRLSRLPKDGITAYKAFHADQASLRYHRDAAVAANRRIFADPRNLQRITRFVEHGTFPWEPLSSGTAAR